MGLKECAWLNPLWAVSAKEPAAVLWWAPFVLVKLLIQWPAHHRKGFKELCSTAYTGAWQAATWICPASGVKTLHRHYQKRQKLWGSWWEQLTLLYNLHWKMTFWPTRNWAQGTTPRPRASSARNELSDLWITHLQVMQPVGLDLGY